MKFGVFGPNGVPLGFYSPEIHGPLMVPVYGPTPAPTVNDPHPKAPVIAQERNPAIPAGAVELTDEQWLELLRNPGTRRWTGSQVEPITT